MGNVNRKKTGGRLKIDVYPSETLVKTADLHDATVSGVINMSNESGSGMVGRIPLYDLTTCPFLWKSGLTAAMALNELYFSGDIRWMNTRMRKCWNGAPMRCPILKAGSPSRPSKISRALSSTVPVTCGTSSLPLMNCTAVALTSSGEVYDALSKGMIDWSPHEWEGHYV